MPNAKVLEQKQQLVAELREKIAGAVAGVVVDYKGTTVADDTALRKELREAGIEYFVVKNTLLSRAIEGTDLADMSSVLEGTTAIALSNEDYTAAARILSKYVDTHKDSTFCIKTGFVDGEVMDSAKLTALGKLPSKDVLVAMVLGGLQATISGFARAINAVAEARGGSAEAPKEEAAEAAA